MALAAVLAGPLLGAGGATHAQNMTFGCAGSTAVGGSSVTSGGLVDDCEALLASEAQLVGTGTTLNWDTTTAMGDWNGLTLSGSRVRVVQLVDDGLAGTIPARLGDLSNLRELTLARNRLTGAIPAKLGDLSDLEDLHLGHNRLTGAIPEWLGDLSDLTTLDLSSNELTGAIPENLGGLSNLVLLNLDDNQLTGCIPPALQRFVSTIDTINPQQNNVILPVCSVTLSLSPDSVGEGAAATDITVTASIGGTALPADTTVSVTRTGGTATSGTDYPAISAFTVTIAAGDTLGTATLSFEPTEDNVTESDETVILTGALSGFTSGTATLTIIDNEFGCAGSTAVGGSLVTSGGLVDDCEALLASEAQLVGTGTTLNWDTTTAMGDWNGLTLSGSRVRVVQLVDDGLAGTIPARLGDLSNLRELTLARNRLTGAIPAKLGDLSDLEDLHLGHNRLTGAIPEWLGDLSDLTTLDLSSNELTGAIPENLGGLSNLVLLNLDDNQLTGCIPPALQRFVSTIDTINPQQNNVILPVCSVTLSLSPDSVGEGAAATDITVTASIGGTALPADTTVSVTRTGGTATSGTDYPAISAFTVTIAAGDTLGTATLSFEPTEDNVTESDETVILTGALSGFTSGTATLTIIDNEFGCAGSTAVGGSLVTSGGLVDDCEALLASEAQLVGTGTTLNWDTTTAMGDWNGLTLSGSRVRVVQLVDDGLAGTIPARLGDLSNLRELTLARNRLTGAIPAKLGDLSDLEDLHLGHNRLTGAIPEWLGDLSDLTTLDLSSNELTGAIPENLGGLSNLVLLNLDDNQLTGCIPPALQRFVSTIDTINPQQNNVILPVCSVTLSLSPDSVSEGDAATDITVTASLGGLALPTATTVSVSRTGGTATSGTDYPAISAFTVTIAAGDTLGTATLSFDPTEDNLAEGSETVILTGALSGLTSGTATLTITDNDTAPTAVTLSLAPDTVSEGDAATNITVTASLGGTALPADTTVTVTRTGGTATSGTDYPAISAFTVTIAAGDTLGTATLSFDPTEDNLTEGSETVILTGAVSGFTSGTATLTITDNDTAPAAVTLSLAPDTVSEGAAATNITVTASIGGTALPADTTVRVTRTGGTATSNTDYPAISAFTIDIAAGDTLGTATLSFDPTEDNVYEGSETVILTGSASGLTSGEATLTITDNDTAPAAVRLSLAPDTVSEGDAATNITVTASIGGTALPADTTVRVTRTGGTATSGTDYPAISAFTIDIAAGDTLGTATLSFDPTEDNVHEGSETVILTGALSGLTSGTATLTITDNDSASTAVRLLLDPTTVSEGDAATDITVTASLNGSALPTATTVSVSRTGGTATSGTDYPAISAFTIDIVAGDTLGTATLSFDPTEDNVYEGSETVILTGAVGGLTSGTATLTITDNDTVADTIPPSLVEAEAEGDEVFLTYDELLDPASVPATGDFAVTAGGDTIDVSHVVIRSGSVVSTVTLDLANPVQAGQTVTLDYTPGTNPIRDEAHNEAAQLNGYIVTNVTDDQPIATIEPHNPTVAEDAGEVVLTIVLDRSPASPLSVEWYTVDQTAEAPEDYIARHDETVTFGVGEDRKTISVVIVDDAVPEGLVNGLHESFSVGLAEGPGYRFLPAGERRFTLVWIVDDDAQDRTPPALERAAVNAARLVLTYDEPLDGASRPAAGDFTVTAAGSTVGVSRVRIGGSSVTLTLASAVPAGQAVTLDYRPGANPIRDEAGNNAAALSGRSVTNATDTRAPELNGATVLGRTLVLTYDEALDGASRPAGGDFTVMAGGSRVGVNWAEIGGSSVTLTLASVVQPDETVTLDYTPGANPIRDEAGNNAAALSGQNVTNTTIVASIDPDYLKVSEGAGNAVMTVSLSRPAPVALSVDWATQDGNPEPAAKAPDDYAARETTVNFAPGQVRKTISVPIVDDTLPEPPDSTYNVHESFFVILGDEGDGWVTVCCTYATTVEIIDNDGPYGGDVANDDLVLLDDLTPEVAAAALLGEQRLGEDRLSALDRLGNRNGRYDLGDLLSWIDRCRRGEADCGRSSADSGPVGAAAPPAAVRGRGTSRRTGGRAPGPRPRASVRRVRRRGGAVRCALAALLAAAMSLSCGDGLVGPAAPPEPDPGFLTVELAAPAAHRDIGVLLELEGPGIEAVRAPGLEVYESEASGRRQVILAGSVQAGPLMRFHVPDRNRLALYRVRVLQVTGEDYGLRDPAEYRAGVTPH